MLRDIRASFRSGVVALCAAAAIAAAPLAGCGVKGPLKPPPSSASGGTPSAVPANTPAPAPSERKP